MATESSKPFKHIRCTYLLFKLRQGFISFTNAKKISSIYAVFKAIFYIYLFNTIPVLKWGYPMALMAIRTVKGVSALLKCISFKVVEDTFPSIPDLNGVQLVRPLNYIRSN